MHEGGAPLIHRDVEDDEMIDAVRGLGRKGTIAGPSAAAPPATYHTIEAPTGRTALIATGSGLKYPMAAM